MFRKKRPKKTSRSYSTKVQTAAPQAAPPPPALARRKTNQRSAFKSGRTIAEKRERLETANERIAATKKYKRRRTFRVCFTLFVFGTLAVLLVGLGTFLASDQKAILPIFAPEPEQNPAPTIPVIDEDATVSGERITSRMEEYIGLAEQDFRDIGLKPVKVIIPTQSIREVDFYLEEYSGYIKLTIDRDPAVSVEDAERMLHYLSSEGITEFTYIDVRIDGKAYWK